LSTVITGHRDNLGQVHGVHGGQGAMGWVRLATGAHLHGDWDGIELVTFPPGTHAGLHKHTHTEEIWYFLTGHARVELDGESFDATPGTLVLTPLNSTHGMWNIGDDEVSYLVIEVFPPAITALLPTRRPSEEPHAINHSGPAIKEGAVIA
jgi:mannose-6-phosphate isomerase-like protein (cupin superfamily)